MAREDVMVETKKKANSNTDRKPKRQPPYNVILWDDDDHSYDYVVRMMRAVFGHPEEKGYQIAKEVDASGKAICKTTTRELAELKMEQVHSYGKDNRISRCKGSMSCSIEPLS
jgi:ATP-dependent Clp protease adaptor protein ClpS